jgi:hypothetical protein
MNPAQGAVIVQGTIVAVHGTIVSQQPAAEVEQQP